MLRGTLPVALGAILSAACEGAPAMADRVAADVPLEVAVREDAMPDAMTDAGPDAMPDAGPDATCDLDAGSAEGGTTTGFLRFANLTRGGGTLRFTARNLPMFREAFIEAVVPEGAASAQVPTLAVAYEIREIGRAHV